MNLCTEQPAVTRRQQLLLLLLLLLLTSSPLCSRVSASARARSNGGGSSRRVVRHLPGFDGPLPFELETGYMEVDRTAGVRLFYYFIRSEHSPADDPLLLWLTGGPGCSAFSGLVYEVGPLTFDLHHGRHGRQGGELPRLLYKPESWTKRASVIFLDSPVGTGFSYAADADTDGAGFRTGDTIAVRHILSFLRKWLQELHPDLLSNPLYIAGDSYSGMIVPAVALGIATSSPEPHQPSLNLKTTGYTMSIIWANNDTVREALGIHQGTVPSWQRCNFDIPYTRDIKSSIRYHLDLTTRGYRSLIYSGDHDMGIPFIGTQAWIRSLNFSVVDEWRPWFVDGQVGG
uniref:Serine carboxypeptidase-like 19 n=1 Tax=Oryza barthii TaxID=65489 RepID=A0A0D3HPD1_9ORYZ